MRLALTALNFACMMDRWERVPRIRVVTESADFGIQAGTQIILNAHTSTAYDGPNAQKRKLKPK